MSYLIQNITDIGVFEIANRATNDSNNTKRENIIVDILNNTIPENYYTCSKWVDLKNHLDLYIKQLCKMKNIQINTLKCTHTAGRGNHNDFKLLINTGAKDESEIVIEFKFGAKCVNDTPQFVSPMKPSQYLNIDFADWYYENYLAKIANYGKLELPDKDEYLKTVNSSSVKCLAKYKAAYDTNIEFNKYCKTIDKLAIKEFIGFAILDIGKLSGYLLKTQYKKEYMCYKNGGIYHDTINEDLYKIKAVVKLEPTNFICITECGKKIEVKLRFKNGCGLQFPAFQIKRKIPAIKELKEICRVNNIKPPKLKRDICKLLDEHMVNY